MKISLPPDTWVLVGEAGTIGKLAHYTGLTTVLFCEQVEAPTGIPPMSNDISDYMYEEDTHDEKHPIKFYDLKNSSRNVWACSIKYGSTLVQVKEN